uniref:GLOBIN domain-containing protein n=1 Tax=Elaeophora elaphi TaxID=1147741 RepID=A0A0R3RZJ4_9BILA
MGNIGSLGSGAKEHPKIDLISNEASSSRPQLARKASQSMISRNPRLSVSSQGRKSSALALSQQQIVKGCMDKAKDDIAERIYRRIIDKRDDFRKFVKALPEEQRCELANALRNYLKNAVNQLGDRTMLQRISEDFGARHVQYRTFGFRPDFFAITADAVTTECVLLDAAIHPASEALFAWSTLTSFMFSSVRDGYYNEQRRVRKASQQFIHRGEILLPDSSIDTLSQFSNERKKREYDAGEMGELEISKDVARRKEEEVQCRFKEVKPTISAEIAVQRKESKDLVQSGKEIMPGDKYVRSDVHRQFRIAFHTHRDSTI